MNIRAQGSLKEFLQQYTSFFFFSLSGYLETAALITANNLDLIFSLSKNVMVYQ